jgi:hypothetical protein
MSIKLVAIPASDCILSISSIIKLNEAITGWTWWQLQINVYDSPILVKQILDLTLTYVTGKIANINCAV